MRGGVKTAKKLKKNANNAIKKYAIKNKLFFALGNSSNSFFIFDYDVFKFIKKSDLA